MAATNGAMTSLPASQTIFLQQKVEESEENRINFRDSLKFFQEQLVINGASFPSPSPVSRSVNGTLRRNGHRSCKEQTSSNSGKTTKDSGSFEDGIQTVENCKIAIPTVDTILESVRVLRAIQKSQEERGSSWNFDVTSKPNIDADIQNKLINTTDIRQNGYLDKEPNNKKYEIHSAELEGKAANIKDETKVNDIKDEIQVNGKKGEIQINGIKDEIQVNELQNENLSLTNDELQNENLSLTNDELQNENLSLTNDELQNENVSLTNDDSQCEKITLDSVNEICSFWPKNNVSFGNELKKENISTDPPISSETKYINSDCEFKTINEKSSLKEDENLQFLKPSNSSDNKTENDDKISEQVKENEIISIKESNISQNSHEVVIESTKIYDTPDSLRAVCTDFLNQLNGKNLNDKEKTKEIVLKETQTTTEILKIETYEYIETQKHDHFLLNGSLWKGDCSPNSSNSTKIESNDSDSGIGTQRSASSLSPNTPNQLQKDSWSDTCSSHYASAECSPYQSLNSVFESSVGVNNASGEENTGENSGVLSRLSEEWEDALEKPEKNVNETSEDHSTLQGHVECQKQKDDTSDKYLTDTLLHFSDSESHFDNVELDTEISYCNFVTNYTIENPAKKGEENQEEVESIVEICDKRPKEPKTVNGHEPVTCEKNNDSEIISEKQTSHTGKEVCEQTIVKEKAVCKQTFETQSVICEQTLEVENIVCEQDLEAGNTVSEETLKIAKLVCEQTLEKAKAVCEQNFESENTITEQTLENQKEVEKVLCEQGLETRNTVSEETLKIAKLVCEQTLEKAKAVYEQNVESENTITEQTLENQKEVSEQTFETETVISEQTLEIEKVVCEQTLKIERTVCELTIETGKVDYENNLENEVCQQTFETEKGVCEQTFQTKQTIDVEKSVREQTTITVKSESLLSLNSPKEEVFEDDLCDVGRIQKFSAASCDLISIVKSLYTIKENPAYQIIPTGDPSEENFEETLHILSEGAFCEYPEEDYLVNIENSILNITKDSQIFLSLNMKYGEVVVDKNTLIVDNRMGRCVYIKCDFPDLASMKTRIELHCLKHWQTDCLQLVHYPLKCHQNVVIIDIGSCSTRAGILMDQPTMPNIFFPTICAKNKRTGTCIYGMEALQPEVRQHSNLSFPVRPTNKITKHTIDIDLIEGLFKKIFCDLKVDPTEYTVQVCLPRNMSINSQTALVKLLLDDLKAKAVSLTNQALLTLYAHGVSTAVVVDIGDRTDVLPVVDGFIVEGGVTRLPHGGERLIHHMKHALAEKRISLSNDIDSFVVQYIIENLAYVAEDYDNEIQISNNYSNIIKKTVTLQPATSESQHSKNITLEEARFKIPEGLFNPDLWGLDSPGIHHLVQKAIQATSVDVRKRIAENIYVSGGVTMLPGFVERLSKEVAKLSKTKIVPKVYASNYRYHCTYIGACKFAKMDVFPQVCINLEEYTKNSAWALKKCALYF